MKKLLFPLLILIGCAPALYQPTGENTVNGSNLEELKKGRTLYIDHCGSCHSLHLPVELSHEAWESQLDEMQKKAKISDRDKALILQFLTSEKK